MIAWVLAAAFTASFALTAWLLRYSRIKDLIDRPNSRSSHTLPTPRGGGLSMVAVILLGVGFLHLHGLLPSSLAIVMIFGGAGIAAIGFWDDVRSTSVLIRMGVHLTAAAFAVYFLGSIRILSIGSAVMHLGAIAPLVGVLAIVWTLNLFNFMDGIDGLAASEAAFISLGAASLLIFAGRPPAEIFLELVIGAACFGFLPWNWPRAAIFMGDVGSGFLGYSIAVLAVYTSQSSRINVYGWLILGGVFFVDATITLLRRLFRKEPVFLAHRTHAYQLLAKRWNSHGRVTVSALAVNVLWLLPCAALTIRFPFYSFWICMIALAPLAVSAIIIGSGRQE